MRYFGIAPGMPCHNGLYWVFNPEQGVGVWYYPDGSLASESGFTLEHTQSVYAEIPCPFLSADLIMDVGL